MESAADPPGNAHRVGWSAVEESAVRDVHQLSANGARRTGVERPHDRLATTCGIPPGPVPVHHGAHVTAPGWLLAFGYTPIEARPRSHRQRIYGDLAHEPLILRSSGG